MYACADVELQLQKIERCCLRVGHGVRSMFRLPIAFFLFPIAALSAIVASPARADAPSACKFLTIAAVSAALGKPVTSGGITSVVDHAGASASSCMYMASPVIVVLSVDERGTADAAMQAYRSELNDSQAKDKESKGASDEQKTVLEAGIGEGAFSDDMTNGSVQDITAVHGSRLFKVGIVGAVSLPHDRIRTLIQTAVSH